MKHNHKYEYFATPADFERYVNVYRKCTKCGWAEGTMVSPKNWHGPFARDNKDGTITYLAPKNCEPTKC